VRRDASRFACNDVALSGVARSLLLEVMHHTVTARASTPNTAHLPRFVGLAVEASGRSPS
jgi:hypothetical protein